MEKEIRSIMSSTTLTSEEKTRRIQALYASRNATALAAVASSASRDVSSKPCGHYARSCDIETPCCSKFYPCRLCHDEAESLTHTLDRFSTQRMRCRLCGATQPCAASCVVPTCAWRSTLYYCAVCRLWSDDEQKRIFHCEDCGICRIGERSEYHHCAQCEMCVPVASTFPGAAPHKCVPGTAKSACVCGEQDLRFSIQPVTFLDCGHAMHIACRDSIVRHGSAASCPQCRKSIFRDLEFEKYVARVKRSTPMPEEYAHVAMEILCNDCEKKSVRRFHFHGMHCPYYGCGSMNTSVLQTFRDDLPPITPDENLPEGESEEGGDWPQQAQQQQSHAGVLD